MGASHPASASDEAFLLERMSGCTPVVTLGFLRRSRHCVMLVENDGQVSFMSMNGRRIFGMNTSGEGIDRYWWQLWPSDVSHVLRNAVTRGRLGETVLFTGDCPTGSGRLASWDVSVTPVRDPAGQVVRLLVVLKEIAQVRADRRLSG